MNNKERIQTLIIAGLITCMILPQSNFIEQPISKKIILPNPILIKHIEPIEREVVINPEIIIREIEEPPVIPRPPRDISPN